MVKTSVTNYIIAVLTVGLFFTGVFSFISDASTNYDLNDFDNSVFQSYVNESKTNEFVEDTAEGIDNTQAERSAFDVIGDLISRALSPFRDALGGVVLAKDSIGAMMSGISLPKYFVQYVLAVITMVIFISVFLFRILLGKDDEVT